jgi:predicted permease
MSLFRNFAIGLRSLFRKNQVDRELDEELGAYLEMEVAEKVRQGVSRTDALREVRLERGSLEVTKELVRSGGWESFVDACWQDFRFAARMLRKNPSFTLIALLSLTLGIAASAIIFSMVNSVLLRPLAYREPQRLYLVREVIPQLSNVYPSFPANIRSYVTWERECHSFDQVGIVEPISVTLTGLGDAEQISGAAASANLFDVLGIAPQLGRLFLTEEDAPGKDHVVIITNSFWRTRFHGDSSVIGRSLSLDGRPYQVVGVLPPTFHFPKGDQLGALTQFSTRTQFFKPLGIDPSQFSPLGEFDFAAIARIRPGVSSEQALAELNTIQAHIAKDAAQGMDLQAQLIPLESEIVGPARSGLLMLLAGVVAVLIIVCLNLTNLSLARVPQRMREASIRSALGAPRGRLLRQNLVESLLLAIAGGLLGTAAAYVGLHWLVTAGPVNLPRLEETHIDSRVLWFACSLSVLTGIFFGTFPAWRIAHGEPQQALKSGGLTSTEGLSTHRLRQSLIAFEVGASTLLLLVAGLLTLSLAKLLATEKGFTTYRVLVADVNLPPQNYTNLAVKQEFYRRVLAAVHATPSVTSAGWISKLPLEGQEQVDDINIPGHTGMAPIANYRYVTPDYFRAMGIPLLEGRWFQESDADKNLAIISESVAKRVWPGQDPIGKQFRSGSDEKPLTTITGVCGDVRSASLEEAPLLMVYLPASERSTNWSGSHASLVVRTAIDPLTLGAAVRSAIHGVDQTVPILHLRTMAEIVSESVAVRRFQMTLVLLFALFALLVAALGIYGVVANSVEQRRQELGIRRALGAQASDIRNLILRRGVAPATLGLLVGTAAGVLSGRLIRSLLYGVTTQDPLVITVVALFVLLTAVFACYAPASRAVRSDPMRALKYE